MQYDKNAFIEFSMQQQALQFGDFQLKSGRQSPYFFNAGRFQTGRALSLLGRFYAQAIVDSNIHFDMLFGPAYKGIPLVAATAIALAEQFKRDMPYCFNRKETKAHGEGGNIVGAALQGRVLLIDDVITAGTAIRESAQIIGSTGAALCGIVISLDRQERGSGKLSAVEEVAQTLNVPVIRIASLDDLLNYLGEKGGFEDYLPPLRAYRSQYAV